MTILLDFSLIAPGGSATYARSFLMALSSRKDLADIVVIVPHQSDELTGTVEALVAAGAHVHLVRWASGWRAALQRQLLIPWYSVRYKARAVYCPREVAPLLTPVRTVVLANNLKVWSPAGWSSPSARARWLARTVLARLVVRRGARVLAVSSVMARALPARVAELVTIVHHGCDLDLVDHGRLDVGEVDGPLRVVALGTISRHKRFDTLIDAVAALGEQGQTAHLDIWGPVGDEACAHALRTQGRRLLGADPLRGGAPSERRQEVLRGADVLAMGSSLESFGFPLVEGMRTSCLVWVPESELVDELCGPAAVTYPEGSAPAAAGALIAALSAAPERLAQGRARSRVYTWESTVESTLRAVREVAGGCRRRKSSERRL